MHPNHPLHERTPAQLKALHHASRYFSLKVATDQVFCNRTEELQSLADSIACNEHVVVVAPRRYGKTSLIMRAIGHSQIPHAMVDLFCVSYQEEVARKLAKAVTDIAQQFMGRFHKNTHKIFETLEGIFRSASISLKSNGLEVGVDFSQKDNPISQITDLLNGLELLAQKMDKQAVLFLDEFQDILKADESINIQSAIRSVAQHAKNITYIFSGSSRTLLEHIFDHANQPLYLMCKKMILKRIPAEHLSAHMRHAWHEALDSPLPQSAADAVCALSQRHTYYFNHLCLKLIPCNLTLTPEVVTQVWDHMVEDEQRKITADLQNLTTNQMKVLTHVALPGSVSQPNSQTFVNNVSLPLSSIQRAVHSLLASDYLCTLENGALTPVDPAIRSFLCKRYEG